MIIVLPLSQVLPKVCHGCIWMGNTRVPQPFSRAHLSLQKCQLQMLLCSVPRTTVRGELSVGPDPLSETSVFGLAVATFVGHWSSWFVGVFSTKHLVGSYVTLNNAHHKG